MAARPTIYYAGGEDAVYTEPQWAQLDRAWQHFASNFYGGDQSDYARSPRGVQRLQTFAVWRADHRPLTKLEREALSWFFHGVISALGILARKKAPEGAADAR